MGRSEILASITVVLSIAAIIVSGLAFTKAPVPIPPEGEGLSGKIIIAGSTTVLPITQEWARLFMEKHPDVRISVSGGGSGHGVRAVGAGEIDIGAASRNIKPEEIEMYPDLMPIGIGKDTVVIVIHPSNPVEDLTMEQVSKIFSGEIKNWKEVGGEDKEIYLNMREEGSGTRAVFTEKIMEPFGREVAGEASIKPSNGEVRATVSSNDKSVGILSLGYADPSVKIIKINGVEPTIKSILAGKYPTVRTLYLITKGKPSRLENAFINFVLSEEGQRVVEDMGYTRIM